jgi:ribonucleoside-triphosphate reductase (formate)
VTPSIRAQVITRRTYNRPLDTGGFETWDQTVARVIRHQEWLWERAIGRPLNYDEQVELNELCGLFLDRKALPAGRTLWLGGTPVSRTRESSMFNCSFTHAETVWDMVDILWLLLQGCGVGFRPITGTLTGFRKVIPEVEVIRSTRTEKGGVEGNVETVEDGVWTIKVGDSAEAWAKSLGKLLAHPHPANKLVLDFSEIRPAGFRLAGYGWISSGDEQIAKAFIAIAKILNKRAGSLLRRMDILDIINWMGTILSSRRSAEIALFEVGDDEWVEFALAKKDYWSTGNEQRGQSNNSLLFNLKPTRPELERIFRMMIDAGGSEPGFINAAAARQRAPWFKGVNPCAEILLGNKSFCNLTEIDLAKFIGDAAGLRRAAYLIGRANYRQTCVDLRDGILQEAWHLNNDFLRLCGVGITGVVTRPDMVEHDFAELRRMATYGAMQMADELGTPRPKNVTTVKPSGTLSKIMDTTEGVHKPLGRFIFNNVQFGKHDPLIPKLVAAGYYVFDHPHDASAVLVRLPVEWPTVDFGGGDVNLESAIDQLERYRMLMRHWCDQNVSATISYDADEVPGIIDWLLANWDQYVGVSFLFRTDPTKTAKDLGYAYLPQEVVDAVTYRSYVDTLQPVVFEETAVPEELEAECEGGACPIR